MVQLSVDYQQKLDDLLARYARKGVTPAAHCGVAGRDDLLYFGCDGHTTYNDPASGRVTQNTYLQLLSATKLVTTIACLQLCERCLADLDDPQIIKKFLPELWAQPILEGYTPAGEEITRPRTTPLTMRHLLSHTSGLGYSYNSPLLERWIKDHDHPDWFTGDRGVVPLEIPLMFEPGTHWRFSLGIDWAGVLVSRISAKSLEAYFQEDIFGPLNLKSFTFYPSEDVKGTLQPICIFEEGTMRVDGAQFRPRAWSPDRLEHVSGGAGLFGTAKDFLLLLQAILRCRHVGGIITPASFGTLFENCLDSRKENGTQYTELVEHGRAVGVLDSDHLSGKHLEFGVGLLLNNAKSSIGRNPGTGCGDGAARTHWWIDIEAGIVALCFTQLLVFVDHPWFEFCKAFERTIYDGLERD